jgi:RNA polymerase sigma-70 factor (ECF subfamily)
MRSPSGWTYTVALNYVRRTQRRSAREALLLRRATQAAEVEPPAGEAWAVVGDLPPRQRTAVVLRYGADLTEAEVATAMGVTRGTVSSTLREAHRKLAGLLDERQEEEAT